MNRGPAAGVRWWAQKRRSLFWLAASLAGAWAGCRASLPPWSWALAGGACLAGLIGGRRRGHRAWYALLLAALAASTALSASLSAAEYAWRERHYPRGERRLLEARIVDVVPHSGGRLALLAVDLSLPPPPPFAGPYWVRVVGEPRRLLEMLELYPPSPGGAVTWPVRVYPFSPRGNPGEFDAREWAMRRGYVATAYLEAAGSERGAGEEGPCALSRAALRLYDALEIGSPWGRLAWRWRCRLAGSEASDSGAIAVAMLLGHKDLIAPELQEAFGRAGISHLLAVSGLHMGFVLAMALPFIARVQGPAGTAGRWARARRWAGFGLLGATVLGYVALTGGPASAARAGLMALVGFGARQMGRPLDPWHALGVAGTALLAYQPLFALDLGFQMSFLAVGGILWALGAGRARPGEARMGAPGPQGTAALPRRPGGAGGIAGRAARAAAAGIRVSAGAQLATAPLVAAAFSEVSWIAPLVNLAAVPLGGAAVMFLAAGALLGELSPGPGDGLIAVGRRAVDLLVALARQVPPWGAAETPMPSAAAAAGWYLLWFGVTALGRWSRHPAPAGLVRLAKRAALAGAVLAAGTLLWPAVKGLLGVAEVWVLDVGQGDAVLVRSGWGRAVIIDGGGVPGAAASGGFDVGDRRVVPALKRLGVRRLEAVLNTHPHEDHVHGLAAVIAQREVNGVFAAEIEGSGAAYRMFLQAAAAKGLPVQPLKAGMELVLEPGLSLVVLAAGDFDGASGGRRPSVNDRSAVLLLRHRAGSALFPGDIEERGQRRLLAQEAGRGELALSGVDVLLVPHHGDRVTAFTGLLPAARPKIAVISVGPNRYGHPAREVLEHLESLGARVWRTDRHGAVKIQFWPWGLWVRSVR